MKVIVQRGKGPERQGELFVIGQCLGLEIDKVMIRSGLTPTQWSLLARSAGDREKE